jgi:polysaccharide export outer membrane protein
VEPAEWPEDLEPALRIQPGDQLLVRFTYTPELDEEQLVRPDGMISLPLVGGVAVAGKTPEELRAELAGLYAAELRDPEINVVIRGLESHKVYVSGEVLRPGVVPMTGPLTALQAVMAVGGFDKRSAKTRTVVVLRQRGDRQFGRTIDLRAELENAETAPFYLEPFDIVYVPRTGIDRANQWVDQYVNNMIPDKVNFGLNYTFFREVAKADQDQRNITVAP